MQILLINLCTVGIAFLHIDQVYCACAHAEYAINGQCCPMCAPGNHVSVHCTVDTSTTCSPCSESTYTSEPNGLEKCFSCSACDAGLRIRIQKACTRLSDTVCEPLELSFCVVKENGSCKLAAQHSQCKPGQYIQQRGTATTDTVCGDCTNGTYSDGTFTACQTHSVCQGSKQIKAGTTSSDVRCEHTKGLVVGITTGVVVIVVIGFLITMFAIFICKLKPPPRKRKRFETCTMS